jgi:large subunit ribosomal protein L22
MLITAEQKSTRQTARKVRLVADVIRKMSLEDALRNLAVMDRKASIVVMKVMRQALANAWHNHGLQFKDLTFKDITVNEGPTYKRFRAVSRGRAHRILKRTCHVRVALESKKNIDMKAIAKKKDQKSAKKAVEKKESVVNVDKTAKQKVTAPKVERAHIAKQAVNKSVNRVTQGK